MTKDDVVRMFDFISNQPSDMKRQLCFMWFHMKLFSGCFDVDSIISDWHAAVAGREFIIDHENADGSLVASV